MAYVLGYFPFALTPGGLMHPMSRGCVENTLHPVTKEWCASIILNSFKMPKIP